MVDFIKDFFNFLLNPWVFIPIGILASIESFTKSEDEGSFTKSEDEDRLKRRAKIEAEIKATQDRVKRKREKAEKAEKLAAEQAEELLSYMPSKLSQLTPLVSQVIDNYDFSECHNTIQLLTFDEAQSVLRDYSEGLARDYRAAIKEFIDSGYSTNSFPHRKKVIREKYDQLTEKAVELGARAIAKKIGYVNEEIDHRPVQDYNTIQDREKRKREKAEKLAAEQAEELLSYMPSKLSQLTPLVSQVIDNYDFSECHNTIQLLTFDEAQSVLRDYSEGLARDYRAAIKEFIDSGYSTNSFPHRKKVIREKYVQLTEKAVGLGARAIAEKIGYVNEEIDLRLVQDYDSNRGSALRKTKKWEES